MALLVSALAINAYVLTGPAVMPLRTTGSVMLTADDPAAKAAWLAKLDAPSFSGAAPAPARAASAPKTAAPPGVAYGQPQIAGLSIAQVYKKQAKAKKSYEGKDMETCGDRTAKGWQTKQDYRPVGTPHF